MHEQMNELKKKKILKKKTRGRSENKHAVGAPPGSKPKMRVRTTERENGNANSFSQN